MKTYAIHMDTVQNFADYIYMLEHYSFCGVIQTGRYYIEPGDLMFLFEYAPADSLFLQINSGDTQYLAEIEEYLRQTGLLAEHRRVA